MDKKLIEILRAEGFPLTRDGVLGLLKRHSLHPIPEVLGVKGSIYSVVLSDVHPYSCPRSCLNDLNILTDAYPDLASDYEVRSCIKEACDELQ